MSLDLSGLLRARAKGWVLKRACKETQGAGGSESGMSKAVSAAARRQKQTGSRENPLGSNSEIGRKLKQYYDNLVSEAVPDRFQELLQQLEEREQPQHPPASGRQTK